MNTPQEKSDELGWSASLPPGGIELPSSAPPAEADLGAVRDPFAGVEDPEAEQRRSFRCPVSPSQERAVLKVGRRRYAVRLVNESSGGYGAWIEQSPRLKPNDQAELLTAFGQYAVRVAYVMQVAVSAGMAGKAGPAFRLGLERVRELAQPRRPCDLTGNSPVGSRLGRLLPANVAVGILGAIIAFAVAAAVMGTVALKGYMGFPSSAGARNTQLAAPAAHNSTQRGPPTLDAVAREVGLSESQRKEMLDIVQRTGRAMQALDARWQNDPPQERLRKEQAFLKAVRQEVLQMLSPSQRQHWEKLFE